MIKGFDAEFSNLDHYIRVITDRIWEGRRIDDINRYYSSDCAVETPSIVSVGAKAVIDGTIATEGCWQKTLSFQAVAKVLICLRIEFLVL
jgi:hypothetical protein